MRSERWHVSGCRYESGEREKSSTDTAQYPDRARPVEDKGKPPAEICIGQRIHPPEPHEQQSIDRDLSPIGRISSDKLLNEGEEEDDPLRM